MYAQILDLASIHRFIKRFWLFISMNLLLKQIFNEIIKLNIFWMYLLVLKSLEQ